MFDLDREIHAWSTRERARRCGRTPAVAEMEDHLHCEIDRLRKEEGLRVEEAFAAATAGLARSIDLGGDRRAARGPLLAHAFIWAALILASAIVLHDREGGTTHGLLLTLVLVPLWFASDQLLRRVMRLRGRG